MSLPDLDIAPIFPLVPVEVEPTEIARKDYGLHTHGCQNVYRLSFPSGRPDIDSVNTVYVKGFGILLVDERMSTLRRALEKAHDIRPDLVGPICPKFGAVVIVTRRVNRDAISPSKWAEQFLVGVKIWMFGRATLDDMRKSLLARGITDDRNFDVDVVCRLQPRLQPAVTACTGSAHLDFWRSVWGTRGTRFCDRIFPWRKMAVARRKGLTLWNEIQADVREARSLITDLLGSSLDDGMFQRLQEHLAYVGEMTVEQQEPRLPRPPSPSYRSDDDWFVNLAQQCPGPNTGTTFPLVPDPRTDDEWFSDTPEMPRSRQARDPGTIKWRDPGIPDPSEF